MKRHILVATLATLAACGSGRHGRNGECVRRRSRAGDAQGRRDQSFVNPGKWKQTATLVEIDAPGMPPQVAEAMKKSMGTSQVHETCLTPEKAKNPREDFFTGADKNCRYEHFKWGDGKIDLKMLCTHENATQTMELAGTYQPNAYKMAMSVASKGSNPAEVMNMKMNVDAQRVGECDASQG